MHQLGIFFSFLDIVLVTPLLVNSLAGTHTLGAVVHSSIPVFLVARRDLPRLADIEFDSFVLAFVTHDKSSYLLQKRY